MQRSMPSRLLQTHLTQLHHTPSLLLRVTEHGEEDLAHMLKAVFILSKRVKVLFL